MSGGMGGRLGPLAVGLALVVGVAWLAGGEATRVDPSAIGPTEPPPAPSPTPTVATPSPTPSPPGPVPWPTGTDRPEPGRTTDLVPDLDPALPRADGYWIPEGNLAAAPVDLQHEHIGVWTRTGLVVGFEEDVAALRPDWTWRELPPHPAGVGRRMVTWSGREAVTVDVVPTPCVTRPEPCIPEPPPQALDPVDGTWRALPPLPVPVLDTAVMARVGDGGVLVWGPPASDPYAPPATLLYNPDADTWRPMYHLRGDADPPLGVPEGEPVDRITPAGAVWTGEAVLVWGTRAAADRAETTTAFGALWTEDEGWSMVPFPAMRQPGPGVWARDRLVVFDEEPTDQGWAYEVDPAAGGSWTALPVPDGLTDPRTSIYGGTVAWTGRHVLFFGGYARSAFLAWDPAGGGWTVLPPDRSRVGAISAWTGQHLIVWGGYGRSGPDVETAIWLPPDDWCHPTADGRPSCP